MNMNPEKTQKEVKKGKLLEDYNNGLLVYQTSSPKQMTTQKSKYGILSSSVDPKKLSLTVQGVVLSIIPVAIFVARMNGVTISEYELVEIAEQALLAVTAGITFVGVVRKLVVFATNLVSKFTK